MYVRIKIKSLTVILNIVLSFELVYTTYQKRQIVTFVQECAIKKLYFWSWKIDYHDDDVSYHLFITKRINDH